MNETQLIKRRERKALWSRVMSDYQCQLVAIETMQSTIGDDFKDSCLVSEHGVVHEKSNGRVESSSKAGVPKGIFTIPYLLYAYDVSRSSFKRRKKDWKKDFKVGTISKPESEKPTCNHGTSVINNSAMCKERYSARFCFVQEKLLSGEGPDIWYEGIWNTHMARQKYWGSEYDERASRGEMNVKDKYHRLARQHLARPAAIN